MKRADLVRKITQLGCELLRHGGRHDWYQNKESKVCQPVPRHREISEDLAKSIIKKLS